MKVYNCVCGSRGFSQWKNGKFEQGCTKCESPYPEKLVKNIGLVNNRHVIPDVDEYVFEKIKDPTRTEDLELLAERRLKILLGNKKYVNLYTTGLTTALIAVLNACKSLGVQVWVWHYDRHDKSYYRQDVK